MNKIKMEQKNGNHILSVPENITRQWYNLSDFGDRVAINYNLSDDYHQNSQGISILDKQVHNTYEYAGNKNPHKSYGYLRTPEMSEIVHSFLCRGRSPLAVWLTEQYYRLYYRYRLKK